MNYKIDHVPINKLKRPGITMVPEYITIHSTGNEKSTAQNERDWLVNPTNKRQASWHIAVDEKQAVEAIPLNEVAWHAGDKEGNRKSIGIEICESGNREKTIQNTVKLVAGMLKERGWGVDRLRRHYDWSGKNCPRIMSANNWAGWEQFKQQVQVELEPKQEQQQEQQIKIRLHGREMMIDGELKDGVTKIPIRFLEQLGYKVDWDNGVVVIDYAGNR